LQEACCPIDQPAKSPPAHITVYYMCVANRQIGQVSRSLFRHANINRRQINGRRRQIGRGTPHAPSHPIPPWMCTQQLAMFTWTPRPGQARAENPAPGLAWFPAHGFLRCMARLEGQATATIRPGPSPLPPPPPLSHLPVLLARRVAEHAWTHGSVATATAARSRSANNLAAAALPSLGNGK
jgi:hypothetical protein